MSSTLRSIAMSAVLVTSLSGAAFAQWPPTGAELAGRFSKWKENSADPYSPELAIGASSLAFSPDGTLYLACEKHADVLMFDKDGSAPQRIRLTGVKQEGGFPDVDIEAMSIHGGVLYLMNEDCEGCDKASITPEQAHLFLYSTRLDNPGPVKIIPIEYTTGTPAINPKSTDGNPSNLSSIEGLVVSNAYYGRQADKEKIGQGPYVYLLDELDITGDVHESKLYIGTLKGDRVTVAVPPISFRLEPGYRMPELFEFQKSLYSLKTNYIHRNDYRVFQLSPEDAGLHEACNFSDFAIGLKGYDTNYEGAAVNPLDNRLFLTADNENFPDASSSQSPPRRPHDRSGKPTRGRTPIITLKAVP